MHKIVALWAVPRSTSNAFEWMMRQRGDLDCLDEPFDEAWYQCEAPLWVPVALHPRLPDLQARADDNLNLWQMARLR